MQETNPLQPGDEFSTGEKPNDAASAQATDSAMEQGIDALDTGAPGTGESETGAPDAAQLQADLEQTADRLLRLQAEMENLRNRTNREIAETRRYAALPLMRDLLPAVDNMSRAMESAEGAQSVEGLLEGFKMVQQQLFSVLAQHNCTEIAALGEPFDPNFHEAILQQPSEEIPAQSVCLVTQSGYQLHDRVIRPSQVIVSTGPAQADSEE